MSPNSPTHVLVMVFGIIAEVLFVYTCIRKQEIRLLHKLFIVFAAVGTLWLLALIAMSSTNPNNITVLWVLDCVSYIGAAFAPVFALLIAAAYVNGFEKLPHKYYLLFIVPTMTDIVAWTNPYHHLMYKVFSVSNEDVVFGPYMYVSGVYSYLCIVVSVWLMIRFVFKNKSKLYIWQALLFSLGSMIPIVVNMLGVFKVIEMSNSATPIAFVVTIIMHGFAIFRFHMLDIEPIALQRVLDLMSDCYIVTNHNGLIVNYNKSFYELFGRTYKIRENMFLHECVDEKNADSKAIIYNLMTSFEQCRETLSSISYEQSMILPSGKGFQKKYYIVEVAPLIVQSRIVGFLAYFKDVTKVKESMKRMQENNERMMEQDRLASLGQLVGGIAHNLKTPIMAISGSTFAAENLVSECIESLGDKDVTLEDYREIYSEMQGWLIKMREACAYMSDIITTVKEQAVKMNTSEKQQFSVDEMLKRVSILLNHELVSHNCRIVIRDNLNREAWLSGDVNNMVQVINNLVSNAVYAEKQNGGGQISLELDATVDALQLRVRDTGSGVPEYVRNKLFKQMITSKGALGSGLGLFISNSVIKGKFYGEMLIEDNPGGGSVFGISIPLEYVVLKERKN